jgi:dihydrofolate reductase
VRDVLLNLTVSLDGFIADASGGVGWLLPPPIDVPVEYTDLIGSVDTLIMGRLTYETSLALDGGLEMFDGKRVYVFTSSPDLLSTADVTFVCGDPVGFVERLKAEDGGTIWLYGGGRLATALSDAGLVDEYLIAIQPILLGDGVPLWRSPHGVTLLAHASASVWDHDLVVLRYRLATEGSA